MRLRVIAAVNALHERNPAYDAGDGDADKQSSPHDCLNAQF